VCVCVCDDADGSKLRQNDCQLGRLNAYSHDAIDDNDDLMNPATPITSVRTTNITPRSLFRGVKTRLRAGPVGLASVGSVWLWLVISRVRVS